MTAQASISLPDFEAWGTKALYDYVQQISDYETLEDLGSTINAARFALFKVNDQINKYERKEKLAKTEYDRAYRRAYITSTEKTDSLKRTKASLQCEELENAWLVASQMKDELIRLSYSLRTELQTLQAIGNNIRQQMKME